MKWENVKQTVGRGVYTVISEARSEEVRAIALVDMLSSNFQVLRELSPDRKHAHEILKAYADKAWDIIQNWDIREAGKLRDLFPDFFPRSLQKGRLQAGYDDKGNWDVSVIQPTL